MARKNISTKDKKRLFALSGNKCAFHDCGVAIANSGNSTVFAEICHIEAAEQGGPRYNPNSEDKYRNSFENLILLCQNHHNEIDNFDNVEKYTVEILRKMKQEHEAKMLRPELIQKNPLILNAVIKLIGEKLFKAQENEPQNAPNSDEKIKYNNVVRYKPFIEEYSAYQARLNDIYKEIEREGSTQKAFLLQNIRNMYLAEKGKYVNFEGIKSDADNIIDSIKNKLWDLVDEDKDFETVEVSLLVVLVDAFMRCNILEEPSKS